jgi:hypothetical protein
LLNQLVTLQSVEIQNIRAKSVKRRAFLDHRFAQVPQRPPPFSPQRQFEI